MRKRTGGTHDQVAANLMETTTMNTANRRIGGVGTVSRVIAGLGLICLALTHGKPSWSLTWHDAVLGLIAFPAVMVVVGLAARRLAGQAIHFTGPLGLAINTAVIVALLSNHYTAGGAELFYGATLLVAAWYGQPGCEATVLSNRILGRDDQIGCPAFTPIDALETRRNGPGRRPAEHPWTSETLNDQTHTPKETGPMTINPQQAPATTSPQQAPSPRGQRPGGEFWCNSLLHLSACIAVGALVILAIHWLT
jgi:hypothetical protein